jgi:hypothetical protein
MAQEKLSSRERDVLILYLYKITSIEHKINAAMTLANGDHYQEQKDLLCDAVNQLKQFYQSFKIILDEQN